MERGQTYRVTSGSGRSRWWRSPADCSWELEAMRSGAAKLGIGTMGTGRGMVRAAEVDVEVRPGVSEQEPRGTAPVDGGGPGAAPGHPKPEAAAGHGVYGAGGVGWLCTARAATSRCAVERLLRDRRLASAIRDRQFLGGPLLIPAVPRSLDVVRKGACAPARPDALWIADTIDDAQLGYPTAAIE